jgi:hypothetical protein
MVAKTNKISYQGTIEYRGESKGLILIPGDFVIIKRGVLRYMVLLCPCGCGDELVINLDKRAGPAWRLYKKNGLWSLYPSYWRDTHCCSHFIIWNNNIYWCFRNYELYESWAVSEEVENKVVRVLKEDEFTHYLELAEESGLIPWECLKACEQLLEKGLCESISDHSIKEYFRKRALR